MNKKIDDYTDEDINVFIAGILYGVSGERERRLAMLVERLLARSKFAEVERDDYKRQLGKYILDEL